MFNKQSIERMWILSPPFGVSNHLPCSFSTISFIFSVFCCILSLLSIGYVTTATSLYCFWLDYVCLLELWKSCRNSYWLLDWTWKQFSSMIFLNSEKDTKGRRVQVENQRVGHVLTGITENFFRQWKYCSITIKSDFNFWIPQNMNFLVL